MQFVQTNTQTCRVKAIFSHLVRRQRRTEGHLSLLPPHQVKVKKAAFRFSQSATFYDKKFYAKLKQSVPKICTLCTKQYMRKTNSQHVMKMQGNIRFVLTLSILKK